jgi:hypothetical protein
LSPPLGSWKFQVGNWQFLVGISEFQIGNSQFLIGIWGFPVGNLRFPIGISELHVGNSQFPVGILEFQIGNSQFLVGIWEFQVGNLQFQIGFGNSRSGIPTSPVGILEFQTGNSQFLVGICVFQVGNLQFLVGISEFPGSKTQPYPAAHVKPCPIGFLHLQTQSFKIAGSKTPPPLTGSFERCYVPQVPLLAGVAKLAYAADSKSAGVHSPWGFKSLLRHRPLLADIASFQSSGWQYQPPVARRPGTVQAER